MTESKRFNFAARLVAIALSSITMLWLLCRFPIPTCIGSIVLLGCLLHCMHIARVVDVAVGPDRDLPVRGARGPPDGRAPALGKAFVVDEYPCLGISSPHRQSANFTSGARQGSGLA